MFQSARITLTVWYLVIIMIISLIFSAILYRIISHELDHFAQVQRFRIEQELRGQLAFPPNRPLPIIDPNSIEDVEHRLLFILLGINVGIFVIAGVIGYFLAGTTLEPIQEMVEEQNRFVADASHELRTPLTALKSSIEVSLRDKKLSLTEAKDLLTSNLEEVNQLQTLTDGLLELTQYEQPNGHMPQKISIAHVIDNALKKIEPIAKKKDVKFSKEVVDGEVEGDLAALTELFVILFDNALKYGPEKGVAYVASHVTDGHVSISVMDQGAGIDASDLPHIFDRFYRADKSRSKQKTNGYGLGLSIAQKIVQAHHGSIRVAQTNQKGTTFEVILPIKK